MTARRRARPKVELLVPRVHSSHRKRPIRFEKGNAMRKVLLAGLLTSIVGASAFAWATVGAPLNKSLGDFLLSDNPAPKKVSTAARLDAGSMQPGQFLGSTGAGNRVTFTPSATDELGPDASYVNGPQPMLPPVRRDPSLTQRPQYLSRSSSAALQTSSGSSGGGLGLGGSLSGGATRGRPIVRAQTQRQVTPAAPKQVVAKEPKVRTQRAPRERVVTPRAKKEVVEEEVAEEEPFAPVAVAQAPGGGKTGAGVLDWEGPGGPSPSPTPEPASMFLLATGIASLYGCKRYLK